VAELSSDGAVRGKEMNNISKMIKNAKNAMIELMNLADSDQVLVVSDEASKTIGDSFSTAARQLGCSVEMYFINEKNRPLTEIPADLIPLLKGKTAVINVFKANPRELQFRVQWCLEVQKNKSLSMAHCPGITEAMMTDGPLNVDYKEMREMAKKLINQLDNAETVHITTPAGTDIILGVKGRTFCNEVEVKPVIVTNLPCGEIYCAPEETKANGVLVIDGTMGNFGLPPTPLTIRVKNGSIEKFESKAPDLVKEAQEMTNADKEARVIGELGIGINPAAKLVGNMLEDEKAFGTAHIAFGNNEDFPGGQNKSKTHVDFLFLKPTISVTYLDGSGQVIIKDGELQR
jgi:aminopeptidase